MLSSTERVARDYVYLFVFARLAFPPAKENEKNQFNFRFFPDSG